MSNDPTQISTVSQCRADDHCQLENLSCYGSVSMYSLSLERYKAEVIVNFDMYKTE